MTNPNSGQDEQLEVKVFKPDNSYSEQTAEDVDACHSQDKETKVPWPSHIVAHHW